MIRTANCHELRSHQNTACFHAVRSVYFGKLSTFCEVCHDIEESVISKAPWIPIDLETQALSSSVRFFTRSVIIMRLSLRTLLAFEDHIFDAQQHRQLEQTIPTCEPALQLLYRIRDCVRNTYLSAPGLIDGEEELDPNHVAEYLDHQMSQEHQERFEAFCLSDDKYLSETASIHHIVSNVLGQPARTNRDCRFRCYDLYRSVSPGLESSEYEQAESVRVTVPHTAPPPVSQPVVSAQTAIPTAIPTVIPTPIQASTSTPTPEPTVVSFRREFHTEQPSAPQPQERVQRTETSQPTQRWNLFFLLLFAIAVALILFKDQWLEFAGQTMMTDSIGSIAEQSEKDSNSDSSEGELSRLLHTISSPSTEEPTPAPAPAPVPVRSTSIKSISETVFLPEPVLVAPTKPTKPVEPVVPTQAHVVPIPPVEKSPVVVSAVKGGQSKPNASPSKPLALPEVTATKPEIVDSPIEQVSVQKSSVASPSPLPVTAPSTPLPEPAFPAVAAQAAPTSTENSEPAPEPATDVFALVSGLAVQEKETELPTKPAVTEKNHVKQVSLQQEANALESGEKKLPEIQTAAVTAPDPFLAAAAPVTQEEKPAEKTNSVQNTQPEPIVASQNTVPTVDPWNCAVSEAVPSETEQHETGKACESPTNQQANVHATTCTCHLTQVGSNTRKEDTNRISFTQTSDSSYNRATTYSPQWETEHKGKPVFMPTAQNQPKRLVLREPDPVAQEPEEQPIDVPEVAALQLTIPETGLDHGLAQVSLTSVPKAPLPQASEVQGTYRRTETGQRMEMKSLDPPPGRKPIQEINISTKTVASPNVIPVGTLPLHEEVTPASYSNENRFGRVISSDEEQVIFSAVSANAPWRMETGSFDLNAEQYLLTAAPFRADLELGDNIVIEMIGDSKLCLLPRDSRGRNRIFLDYGRVVIRKKPGSPMFDTKASLIIQTERTEGLLTFSGDRSVAFIDTFAEIITSENAHTKRKSSPMLGLLPAQGETVAWKQMEDAQPAVIVAQSDTSVLLIEGRHQRGQIGHHPNWLVRSRLSDESREIRNRTKLAFEESNGNCEAALKILANETSLAARSFGLRLWGDLGRFDIPLRQMGRIENQADPLRQVLIAYFNEVMKRDDETVQRLADTLSESKKISLRSETD